MQYELAKELKDAGFPQKTKQGHYLTLVQLKESNPDWVASPSYYHSIHQWLKRNFGNPKSCEQCGINGFKEKGGRWSIHFGLKHEYKHSHNPDAYLGLCRTCHGKYDWNEEKTQNMIAAARMQKGSRSKVKSLIAHSRNRTQYGQFSTDRA